MLVEYVQKKYPGIPMHLPIINLTPSALLDHILSLQLYHLEHLLKVRFDYSSPAIKEWNLTYPPLGFSLLTDLKNEVLQRSAPDTTSAEADHLPTSEEWHKGGGDLSKDASKISLYDLVELLEVIDLGEIDFSGSLDEDALNVKEVLRKTVNTILNISIPSSVKPRLEGLVLGTHNTLNSFASSTTELLNREREETTSELHNDSVTESSAGTSFPPLPLTPQNDLQDPSKVDVCRSGNATPKKYASDSRLPNISCQRSAATAKGTRGKGRSVTKAKHTFTSAAVSKQQSDMSLRPWTAGSNQSASITSSPTSPLMNQGNGTTCNQHMVHLKYHEITESGDRTAENLSMCSGGGDVSNTPVVPPLNLKLLHDNEDNRDSTVCQDLSQCEAAGYSGVHVAAKTDEEDLDADNRTTEDEEPCSTRSMRNRSAELVDESVSPLNAATSRPFIDDSLAELVSNALQREIGISKSKSDNKFIVGSAWHKFGRSSQRSQNMKMSGTTSDSALLSSQMKENTKLRNFHGRYAKRQMKAILTLPHPLRHQTAKTLEMQQSKNTSTIVGSKPTKVEDFWHFDETHNQERKAKVSFAAATSSFPTTVSNMSSSYYPVQPQVSPSKNTKGSFDGISNQSSAYRADVGHPLPTVKFASGLIPPAEERHGNSSSSGLLVTAADLSPHHRQRISQQSTTQSSHTGYTTSTLSASTQKLQRGLCANDLEHCKNCGLGLWQPAPHSPSFFSLTLIMAPFADNKLHPSHFTKLVHSTISVLGIIQLIRNETDFTSHAFYIFKEKPKQGNARPLPLDMTLQDFGCEGSLDWLAPTDLTLYYDYESSVVDCPILEADFFLTQQKKKTQHGGLATRM